MTFDQTYKRLLSSGELGLISKREKVSKELYNAGVEAALNIVRAEYVEGFEFAGKRAISEIEKLKA